MSDFKIGDCVCWKDPEGTRDCFGCIAGFDKTNYNGEFIEVAIIEIDGTDQLEIPLEDLENLGQ